MDRPILFKGEMVKALLAGRKTQTRRVVKPQPEKLLEHLAGAWFTHYWQSLGVWNDDGKIAKCPYGEVGDRLWVRETWKAEEFGQYGIDGVRYGADDYFRVIENSQEAADLWMEAHREGGKWRPSIFMPRWASRIVLEVVNIRVERVQDISMNDAIADCGVANEYLAKYPAQNADVENCVNRQFARGRYKALWDSINAKRGFGWDVNPWVWVVEFKVQ